MMLRSGILKSCAGCISIEENEPTEIRRNQMAKINRCAKFAHPRRLTFLKEGVDNLCKTTGKESK